jgi:hypothetical protein
LILIIANQIGRIHHASGNRHLQKTRPIFAFVPEELFVEKGFLRSRYLASRWPAINAGANPLALGSHVIPDPEKPVSIRNRCPILAEFLQRLEKIAAVKTIAAA